MALSSAGGLAFIALISLADDEGRVATDAEHLCKVAVRDSTPADLDAQLAEMVRRGMIRRYEADGTSYVELVHWRNHQKVDHPKASSLPAPPVQTSREPSRKRAKVRASSRASARPRADRIDQTDQTGTEHDARAQESDVDPDEIDPAAVELLKGYTEITCRIHSASDAIKAGEFIGELQALTVPEMVERMQSHWDWCQAQSQPTPRTLGGFWNSLRLENDHRRDLAVDNGARAQGSSVSPRVGELTRIGDIKLPDGGSRR